MPLLVVLLALGASAFNIVRLEERGLVNRPCSEPHAPGRAHGTDVGNAGFLAQVGKKILIDGLFRGFQGTYLLTQEIQDKLALAQAPFDGIDPILAIHTHGDFLLSWDRLGFRLLVSQLAPRLRT